MSNNETGRKIISAFRVSVDGFTEGPNGEVDWVETWEDEFDLRPQIEMSKTRAKCSKKYRI